MEGHAIRPEPILPILHEAREQMNGHIALKQWLRVRRKGTCPVITEPEWKDVLELLENYLEPEKIAQMVFECNNIDTDSTGWFALLVDRKHGHEHHVGRGSTMWEAVKHAHELKRIFAAAYPYYD